MTYSTPDVMDMSRQAALTVLQYEILASYMEDDLIKFLGEIFRRASSKTCIVVSIFKRKILKDIYKTRVVVMISKRILLAGGVCLRHTCMPCIVYYLYSLSIYKFVFRNCCHFSSTVS